jgi:hypothetical protein
MSIYWGGQNIPIAIGGGSSISKWAKSNKNKHYYLKKKKKNIRVMNHLQWP